MNRSLFLCFSESDTWSSNYSHRWHHAIITQGILQDTELSISARQALEQKFANLQAAREGKSLRFQAHAFCTVVDRDESLHSITLSYGDYQIEDAFKRWRKETSNSSEQPELLGRSPQLRARKCKRLYTALAEIHDGLSEEDQGIARSYIRAVMAEEELAEYHDPSQIKRAWYRWRNMMGCESQKLKLLAQVRAEFCKIARESSHPHIMPRFVIQAIRKTMSNELVSDRSIQDQWVTFRRSRVCVCGSSHPCNQGSYTVIKNPWVLVF